MQHPLRVLILEHIPADAELAVHALTKAGMSISSTRVDSLPGFVYELSQTPPDVILADFSLPTMNALDAMRILKERQPGIPFILFTGTQSEEVAALCMREGADDYVLKTSTSRLQTAVQRALAKRAVEREKNSALAALRRSEEQLRLIAEHTRDLICLFDLEGTFAYISPSSRELLGRTPETLSGTNLLDLVHPDDRAIVQNGMQQSLSMKTVPALEYRMRHTNSEWRSFEAAGSWVFSDSGNPVHMVLIARDVTERKKLEAQLLQAQKMEGLGTLAGGIAHDFNNLLSIILGHAHLLEQGEVQGDSLRRNTEAIARTVYRGSSLVRQLLTIARKSESRLAPVNVNDLIDELVKLLRETLPTTIAIASRLVGETTIVADQDQLHQVLLNLCINARDAMPSGGTLTISADRVMRVPLNQGSHVENEREYLLITVEDTGIGMDEQTLSRIFDPFFTTKERDKGTGLGLAIVYGIMNGHRGIIDVESEPGRGTKFHLFFPMSEDKNALKGVTRREQTAVRGSGQLVLLVEDEQMLLDLLGSLLEMRGYRTLRTDNGADAVATFEKHASEISLVLTDLDIPGMNGLDALEQMKLLNPDIRSIIATGFLDEEEKERLTHQVNVRVLQKPYAAADVLTLVGELLEPGTVADKKARST